MSNLPKNRLLLLLLLLLGTTGIALFGQQTLDHSSSDIKCAEHHLLRIAFLLGCCGDLSIA